MGRYDDKVVAITGGARGQGRSHALAFAREGAHILVTDIASQIESVPYPMGTESDLHETQRQVEALGRRCIAIRADARDTDQMNSAITEGIDRFGKIDALIANHGVMSVGQIKDMDDAMWDDCLAVCLTGVFKACRAVLPHMIERQYGRIVITSSLAGKVGLANIAHYVAAKSGVIGFGRSLAVEVADQGITVNLVTPTACNTDMIHNDANYELFMDWGGDESAEVERPLPLTQDVKDGFQSVQAIPIPWIEPIDVSNAMLFLAHVENCHITGSVLNVGAGGFFAA